MIRVLETPAGAYFSRGGVIDFLYYFRGEGTAIERVARLLKVDQGSVVVVRNYSELK